MATSLKNLLDMSAIKGVCAVCGCSKTSPCKMKFNTAEKGKAEVFARYVSRYTEAGAFSADVDSQRLLIPSMDVYEELIIAGCTEFIPGICTACVAELDDAMARIGPGGTPSITLRTAVMIKRGCDCYPDATGKYPRLRNMNTWTCPDEPFTFTMRELVDVK